MTSKHHDLDDRSLDSLIESVARAGAPVGFAERVGVAIDARHASPISGRQPMFAMAAIAAAIAMLAGTLWMTSRHAMTPASGTVAHDATPAPPDVSRTPTIAAPTTRPEQTPPVTMPPRGAHASRHRPSPADDHDRALQALDAMPAVLQSDIAPRSLETSPIDITRMNAITPLTVQGGRDTSGRGDFR